VLAWGYNADGQCTVPTAAQSGIIAIAGGLLWHSLALTADGEVIAWGDNSEGQCTVPVAAQSGIIAISGGGLHSLALTAAGEVLAWGYNYSGQCTVPVAAQSGVIAIAAGTGHSLALTAAGEVLAWGDNDYGQCTVPPAAQSGILAIAGGYFHSLALLGVPMEARFVGWPTVGEPPLAVVFTDLSRYATSWEWDFGDGQTSSEKYPSHTYTSPGIYTVTLTASNAYGQEDTETKLEYITAGPVSQVLLEVHPNERAPGVGTPWIIGGAPWSQPTSSPAGSYWWKKYEFAAHGPLWIQACAQNWDKTQKGYADHDDTKLQVNGAAPTDYDLIQTGPAGGWQWLGQNEGGKRVALRFLVPCTPGKQTLWIGADESPALWWLKVIDLEPGLIEAF